jgi:hypothetical protein
MTAPTVFTTDRLLEFTSVNELSKLVGATPDLWPVVAIKELTDNALDACEDEDIAPEIAIEISTAGGTITVRDNGKASRRMWSSFSPTCEPRPRPARPTLPRPEGLKAMRCRPSLPCRSLSTA